MFLPLHQARKVNTFHAIYIIPANNLLKGTFNGFHLGCKVILSGYISGFNEKEGTWEIQVSLLPQSDVHLCLTLSLCTHDTGDLGFPCFRNPEPSPTRFYKHLIFSGCKEG